MREESYNTKALHLAIDIAKEVDANVEEILLKEFDLPLFNEDVEAEGYPRNVQKIYKKIDECDLLIIASPEYNHSISGVLKNAIDWLSRDGNHLKGKTAVIFGASTGGFGTVKGQLHLREILSNLDVLVYPQPRMFISFAHEAFDDKGMFKDKDNYKRLKKLIINTISNIK